MKTKSDRELLQSYIKGDHIALNFLFKRYESKVRSYIYKKLNDRDLANDILQEVFIKVISTFENGKYREEGKFLPWVLRISHNMIINHYRENKKIRMINESDPINEGYDIFNFIKHEDSIEDVLISEQKNTELLKLIKLLPENQQEILELRFFNDMNFKEIAEHTNVGINTALGRMRYAILNLRKLMTKESAFS